VAAPLLLEGLHLGDEPLHFLSFVGGQPLALSQVFFESVDRLVGVLHLLMAAADDPQVDRIQRLRVELGEELERLRIAARREQLLGPLRPIVGGEGAATHGNAQGHGRQHGQGQDLRAPETFARACHSSSSPAVARGGRRG
jgi:hypothetical protein